MSDESDMVSRIHGCMVQMTKVKQREGMRTLRKTIKIKKNSGLRVDNEGPRFKRLAEKGNRQSILSVDRCVGRK